MLLKDVNLSTASVLFTCHLIMGGGAPVISQEYRTSVELGVTGWSDSSVRTRRLREDGWRAGAGPTSLGGGAARVPWASVSSLGLEQRCLPCLLHVRELSGSPHKAFPHCLWFITI